ncbi:signal transduction histidine kinase [Pseudarthrobacter siccitolerans]|uniref:histidine kinase n=1 Tax=Pseudarthrobacter siccitolerans TaxID=861266 RepID=A0ABU0PP10_9MICC|nr:HAMP domain-containing sensor histidine kinase [Pseudarthrobacter siccitolerans]MDQ0675702.1 signal transduction histidine kinase [Pseudarthrobacter siccitolerans]
MRLRVLGVLSVLSVLLVLIASNTILASAGRELTQELQINRAASLNRLAQVAFDAGADGGDATQLQAEMDRYSELYGEGVLIRLQQGTLRSGGLSEDRADVRDALARASLNLNDTALAPLQPFGTGSAVISRSFGSASQVLGAAVLDVNQAAARQKLRERWLAVGLAAAALAAILLIAAARVTRWVLRPVHRLNAAVAELETTGRSGRLPEEGPPELRELSRSFTAMAHSVSDSIESQRQLIADTSHELRNPVGALRLRIDLLQLELKTAKEQAAAAAVVTELERLEKILDGVLKLAAAEYRAFEDSAGAPPARISDKDRTPLDPFPILQGETERAEPAARLAGASIFLENPPPQPALVTCRADDLAQMVGELLNNAIKYAGPANIAVSVRMRGNTVVIEVSDDGPGLSPEERSVATQRFWRSQQHRAVGGNGLGMTIVDKLAVANGGRLLLAEAQPHGLLACLEFPRAAEVRAGHPNGQAASHE